MGSKRTYSVYRHKSPSGSVYVGITSLLPEDRWGRNGIKYCQHINYPFARAIFKYGWDTFTHEILFDSLPEEKAKLFEHKLISFYKMLGISYNITQGGEAGYGNKSHLGQKASDVTRKRMSDSGSQEVYQYSKDGKFLRKWRSQKEAADTLKIHRGSISAASCGRIPSYKGFYWSPYGPDLWKRPEKRHKESGRRRKVYQFDIKGDFIREWDSVTHINKERGYCLSQIALACNYDGRAHNFLWSYSPEIELKKIEAQKQIAKSKTNKN